MSKRTDLEDKLAAQLDYAEIPYQREVRFASGKRRKTTGRPFMYRADFVIKRHADDEAGIIVEVQGGIWTGGRHVQPKGYTDDAHKHNMAQLMGYEVLVVTKEMIADLSALSYIEAALGRGTLWKEDVA